MGGNTYKSEGVVLKRVNFGEADKIVTIFTKHFGKISLIAKGVRRMTSRKRGNLELFNQVSFFAAKGKGMDVVTETELINGFSIWRDDLKKVAVAYQLCELIDKLTVEDTEQENVYDLLVDHLKLLITLDGGNSNNFLGTFGLKLLILLGYWPKDKPVPKNFRVSAFVEEIIEKELKSKKFLGKL